MGRSRDEPLIRLFADLDSAARERLFRDPEAARRHLEAARWPEGPVCPHCGAVGAAYKLEPRPDSKRPVRPGVLKCAACRRQFTVTVGTVFEGTKLGLDKLLQAIYLVGVAKTLRNAHQLQRELGVEYRTARALWDRLASMLAEGLERPTS